MSSNRSSTTVVIFAALVLVAMGYGVSLGKPSARNLGVPSEAPVCGVPGCGVIVTPDDSAITEHPNTNNNTVHFSVKNDWNVTQTIALTCSSTGNITCVGIDIPNPSVGAGVTISSAVTYNLGAAGSGRLVLKGAGSVSGLDTGWYRIKFLH